MKKVFCMMIVLALFPALIAFGGEIDNTSAEIGVMTQEYDGDNIAEILMIYYEGDQPALAEYGNKNPEIESLNNAVKWGIQQTYNDFIENPDGVSWIEIKSYPFTSDDYLQIVTTGIIYPTYGTDGDMQSYNFNKKENKFIALSDVMDELDLTEDTLTEAVVELYVPEYPSMSVGEVNATGFLIKETPAGTVTELLLEILMENPEADSWKYFFSYIPETGELTRLDSRCLFDPQDMDQMDPPLAYQFMKYEKILSAQIKKTKQSNAEIEYVEVTGLPDTEVQNALNEELKTFFTWPLFDIESQNKTIRVKAEYAFIGNRYISVRAYGLEYAEKAAYPVKSLKTIVFDLETGEYAGWLPDFIATGEELKNAITSGKFTQIYPETQIDGSLDVLAEEVIDNEAFGNFYLTGNTLGLYVTDRPHVTGDYWVFEANLEDVAELFTEKLQTAFE